MEPVKVLIVDDSPVWRAALRDALAADPEVRVVGEARDGLEAIRMVQALGPSLITVDLNMPKLDGLGTIDWVMRHRPTPIVVVTDRVPAGRADATFQALTRGALEVLPKSEDWTRGGSEARMRVEHLKWLARLPQERANAAEVPSPAAPASAAAVVHSSARTSRAFDLLAIGASTGGPGALRALLGGMSPDVPFAVVVVQHMDVHFHDRFAAWLGTQTPLRVTLAHAGERVERGRVYLAPGGQHLALDSEGRVSLERARGQEGHVPSVDRLFRSVAESYGPRAMGLLLTGMGSDGANGLKALRDRGAWTVAQDRESSTVWGMPGQAVALGAACEVLSLEQMSDVFRALCPSRGSGPAQSQNEEQVMQRNNSNKVMVVDDSPVILAATRMTLEDAGYEVLSLENPLLVANAVRREKPDLVLIDVNMPAITGDLVAQIVAQHQRQLNVKVVLYSDMPSAHLAERAQRCGAIGFVRKTANEDDLIAQVRQFLEPTPSTRLT